MFKERKEDMDSITISFDNSSTNDVNFVYNQLKKQYPKYKITKKTEINARKFQEEMEKELKKMGINSEEEFMDWINDAIKETRREIRSENNI